ncbi:MAG: hypothetical protein QXT64_02260 [Desulfurococcaceae archaeon]
MRRLWLMLTEKELAGYVDKYDRNPIAIPLLVASCKKHGWDVYDPFQRVGFVAPSLSRAAFLIRKKFTCPQCGAIHINDVVIIREHKVAVMDMYDFLRKAEEIEDYDDYDECDDYEEEDYG